jgi:hypothetical protein
MGTSAWAWSFFSKVQSSHSNKSGNWLWQLVAIVTMYGCTSWYHSLRLITRQISIISIWGQSAILPAYNYLCSAPTSNLHLNKRWRSKIGVLIPHSIVNTMQKFEYCTSSRRWDISAEEIHKNERRAVCIPLWRISSSVSCIDSKFSHNPPNNITTLPKFWCENFAKKISQKIFTFIKKEGNKWVQKKLF